MRQSGSPDTLRAWERRYQVVTPLRTPGGTRRYRESDVKRLRLLSAASAAGYPIGDLAKLDDAELERRFHDAAVAAFAALGCSGWGRVDFMTGSDGIPQVIEINTIPGMTGTSLLPQGAAAAGIDFAEMLHQILLSARFDR